MRGRKPKPTVLHALQGTYNATKHKGRASEPKAEGELDAKAPEWMSEAQQQGWRFAMENAPRGVLKKIDRGILAIWVEAEDRHRTAAIQQAMLDRENKLPLLIKLKEGPPVASPYLAIMTKAARGMMKAASELGCSPAARPRLASGDGPKPEDSPWAGLELIQGGKTG